MIFFIELSFVSIIFILLSIMLLLRLVGNKSDPLASYIYKRRRMNWKRAFTYWFIFQIIFLFSRNIFLTITMPILCIYLLVVLAICDKNYDKSNINRKDFEEFKKSFERDRKIKKIL